MCTYRRTTPEVSSISLHLSPLRQGLSRNLGLCWQPAKTTKPPLPAPHTSSFLHGCRGCRPRSLFLCTKSSDLLKPRPSPRTLDFCVPCSRPPPLSPLFQTKNRVDPSVDFQNECSPGNKRQGQALRKCNLVKFC